MPAKSSGIRAAGQIFILFGGTCRLKDRLVRKRSCDGAFRNAAPALSKPLLDILLPKRSCRCKRKYRIEAPRIRVKYLSLILIWPLSSSNIVQNKCNFYSLDKMVVDVTFELNVRDHREDNISHLVML